MIILDTNVISEFTRPQAHSNVKRWMDGIELTQLRITAVTETELHYGIDIVPDGKRRDDLRATITRVLETYFADRILPFDSSCASICGQILSRRRKSGRPIYLADAQIAAIALSQSATLATRNIKDFQDIGLTLVNPWEFSG